MDIQEFKKQYVQQELGIVPETFGRILSFVDFGNVNYWFEEDTQNYDNTALKSNEKLSVDISLLKEFLSLFSSDIRFYYGHDAARGNSLKFIQAAENIYGKKRVFTKPMQKIRHHLQTAEEISSNTRTLFHDTEGDFVYLSKCNFDVEISVDAIKTCEHYETICLLSSDADFVHLARYLKGKGKKVILIKGGNIVHQLRKISDVVINAQDIKKHISVIKKQKPGI